MRFELRKRAQYLAASLTAALWITGCSVGAGEAMNMEPAAETTPSGKTLAAPDLIPEPSLTLPEGTVLEARLVQTLSTGTHEVDRTFEATLAEPITLEGQTVAPAGSRLWGRVVESDQGGRVEGRAHLGVQLAEVEIADGGRIGISTDTLRHNARATKREDAEKIGIGAGIGAAIGAIAGGGKGAAIGAAAGGGAGTGAVLATRGEPAVMPSETLLRFTLRHAVTID